jgi:hypothetical protein
VILRPPGSDDCIACPAGQPFTGCAATPCAPSAIAIAANVLHQTLFMFPSPCRLKLTKSLFRRAGGVNPMPGADPKGDIKTASFPNH